MTTLGIIGSGNIGSAIARLAVAADIPVVMTNSRGPGSLADLVAELGPLATAGTVDQAAQAGDLVVLSVPLTAHTAVPQLDVNANELALVYRARGMPPDEAERYAAELLQHYPTRLEHPGDPGTAGHDFVGTGIGAALSSFCFFATGAAIPVLPFLFEKTASLMIREMHARIESRAR